MLIVISWVEIGLRDDELYQLHVVFKLVVADTLLVVFNEQLSNGPELVVYIETLFMGILKHADDVMSLE